MKKLFSELGLSDSSLKAVARMGFEEASPIQSEAIPALLTGRDVVGQSQTGSGKTAAFALPAIERVDVSLAQPQALILCPTRELVVQVAEETSKLAFGKKGLRELPIYGGQSYDRQFRGLAQGAHIVIGTPGRVLDHLKRGSLKLDSIKMLILDEVDRMLDMGFVDDIREVLVQAPDDRQLVFFSATLPNPIAKLIKTFAKDPIHVKIESAEMTVPEIEQVWYEVNRRSKVEVLCRLIDMEDIRYAIIFCATKVMVDDLVEHLIARGYAADRLHGDLTQNLRERVMNRFRSRKVEFLVATDVAARGLDVKDIEVVFNFDLPNDGEDYVHRIGRTGRAGGSGKAITFVAGREVYKFQNIQRHTKARMKRMAVPTLEQVEERRANVFFDTLRTTLEEGAYPRQEALIDRLLDQGHQPTDIISALMHLRQQDEQESRPAVEEIAPAAGYRDAFDRDRGERKPMRKKREDSRRPDRSERGDRSERPDRSDRSDRPDAGLPTHQQVEEPTRAVFLNVGRKHKVKVGDVLGVVLGATKVPRECVGYIELMNAETRVMVGESHAEKVAKKLNGIDFKKYTIETRLE
ncbi:MAG: DEAD/DEAH box helicase [Verrucomicrobia bacterium]|nr:DEAD/DEAH box helicase [Verrucomicrobiota bacterium]MCH8527241.1 DEAD/DEAH box helicase [Kiritimatiellia bacterium]